MNGWQGKWVDIWMDGCVDDLMGGWMDDFMGEWMDGRVGGCMNGWMEVWLDGWIDELGDCTEEWVSGWLDEWVDNCVSVWPAELAYIYFVWNPCVTRSTNLRTVWETFRIRNADDVRDAFQCEVSLLVRGVWTEGRLSLQSICSTSVLLSLVLRGPLLETAIQDRAIRRNNAGPLSTRAATCILMWRTGFCFLCNKHLVNE